MLRGLALLIPCPVALLRELELFFNAGNIHKLGKKKMRKSRKGEGACRVVVMGPRRSCLLCTLPSGLLMAAL